MSDENFQDLVVRVRSLPPVMLDARLLTEYVRAGEAYDLFELCQKSGIALRQVALLIVTGGLDDIDSLPGYAVTSDILDIAENIYALGETRRHWQHVRNRHKPSYLESLQTRAEMRAMSADPVALRKYSARIYFKSWAAFWDDDFLCRMIDRIDGGLISTVPEELLSDQVCFAAVAKTGMALRLVPEQLRSVAICARAVESDPAAIAFTPSRIRAEIRKLVDDAIKGK
ncbi:hypothetical protein N8198_05050 [Gammaproteobacteria bacterium]|nr:hypothetical protein [Gammaproteobacteria bacterium]